MSPKNSHTLYLCYFGLREPLVQTQVLPYLREIHQGGTQVSILTFETNPKESWSNEEIINERDKLAADGITWDFLTYHKTPSVPATVYDVFRGAFFAWNKARREKLDVLHARSHVPAMMGALAKTFSFGASKPKLLFDIRGFFPEEYTDAGIWREDGWIYKSVKKAEKWLLKKSDGFVVLTETAREILFPESKETGFDKLARPVEVIPCCVDVNRFAAANGESRRRMRVDLKLKNRFVAVYVGSFGGWYLTEETADFYGELKKKTADAFALVLTQSPARMIEPLLRERGFADGDFLVKRVSPAEIPLYLSAADAAISFIKPCYSKLASSPTKNAEYLACGLPIVANDGIGDTTEFTETDETGVVARDFTSETYQTVLQKLDELLEDKEVLARRCKESAAKRFDLKTVGGERYRRIYRKLLAKN
jgi:glycosyltransferase involved in cell wall biosynthesis